MIFSKADFMTELELVSPGSSLDLPAEILESRADLLFSMNELLRYKLSISELNDAFITVSDLLLKSSNVPENDKMQLAFTALNSLDSIKSKLTQQEKIIFAFALYYSICVELYDKKAGKMFRAIRELNSPESIMTRLQSEITSHSERFAFLEEKKQKNFPFGSKDNPVPVTSQTAARIYLSRLYTPSGKHVKFSKENSIPAAKGVILDLYYLKFDFNGEQIEMQVYINPNANTNSTQAPEGLEYYEDDPESLFTLAMNLYNGEGVKIDTDKAIEFLRKSSSRGHSESQYNLGLIYSDRHNYNEAIKFFSLAAQQNHLQALVKLGNMYYQGEGVNKDYSKAAEFFAHAAAKGNAESQYYLGFLYYSGEGVEQDKRRAVELWNKAALQGHSDSQYILGHLYRIGKDLRQNYDEALKWFKLAADKNHSEALFSLGQMYENGEGVRRDINQVVKFYNLASEQGHEEALNSLRRLGKI